jgi:hypothetical protein
LPNHGVIDARLIQFALVPPSTLDDAYRIIQTLIDVVDIKEHVINMVLRVNAELMGETE